jgi:hypothetical protein
LIRLSGSQGANPWASIATHRGWLTFHTMMIYQPKAEQKYRVVWYGGESTQLHFEKQVFLNEWKDIDVRTLMCGMPSGVKELLMEMEDYYNHGMILEEQYLREELIIQEINYRKLTSFQTQDA